MTLYVGPPLKTVWECLLVKHEADRMLMGSRRLEHVTPLLCHLHWLPVHFQAQFKGLVLTFKTLTTWHLGDPVCNLISAFEVLLVCLIVKLVQVVST